MSDGNDTRGIDRRQLVKKAGLGALAGSSAISVVSASADEDRADDVLDDPKVESIRRAVEGFRSRGVAEFERISTSSLDIDKTVLDTNVGRLVHVETADGTTHAKLDFVDLTAEPSKRRALPEEFRDVPREASLTLYGTESGVTMSRHVTDVERRKLRRALPNDAGEISAAIYDSATDGFVVMTDESRYQVGSNGRAISPSTVERVVDAQGECDSACASCALWAVNRGLCYGSCALVTSGAGAALCIACLTSNSVGLIFADCDTCADCI